jgi:threonine/homoserine/homoserine lactone efflux protein
LFIQTLVLLWTPGPATIAIMVSGMNFTLYRASIFAIGVWAGYLVNLSGTIAGITLLLSPDALNILQIFFTVYVIYFAYKMSGLGGNWKKEESKDKSQIKEANFTFAKGFALSLLNPKAYTVNLIMYFSFFGNVEPSFFSITVFFVIIAVSDFFALYMYALIGNFIYKKSYSQERMFWLNLISAILFLFVTLGALWAEQVASFFS